MIETGHPLRRLQSGNVWAIACLGLVLASWSLLAFIELADAVLSADSASNSAYDPVYAIIALGGEAIGPAD